MAKLKKLRKYKIHREGVNIIAIFFVVYCGINLLAYYFFPKGALIATFSVTTIFFLLVVNFFRSPRRHFPEYDEGLIVASADGRIVVIEEVMENEYFHDKRLQISIFMSVVNVHANWYPIDGKVVSVKHHKGRFQAAWLPKSSTENERSTIVLKTDTGVEILVRQVAGALARRIVTYAKPGCECDIEEHMGFIKFGSRVDIYLPLGSTPMVEMEQRVTGCQTILAKLNTVN